VEIDGTPYWDGGFSANPPLVALVEACPARDVVLVQINPLLAERAPRTPREIRNRVAEIAFGRPLARSSSGCGTTPDRASRCCAG
jgi:NTE family protein